MTWGVPVFTRVVICPSFPPLHVGEINVSKISRLGALFTEIGPVVWVQPFASVTKQLYVPADKKLIVDVNSPPAHK